MNLNEKLIDSSIEKTLAPILGMVTQAEVNDFLETLEMPLGDYTLLGTWLDDHPYQPVEKNLKRVRQDFLDYVESDLKRYYISFKTVIDDAEEDELRKSVTEGRMNISTLTEAERLDLMSKVGGLQEAYDHAMGLSFSELNDTVGTGSLREQRAKAMKKFFEAQTKKLELSKAARGARDPNAAMLAANRRAFGQAGAIPDKKKQASKAFARDKSRSDNE